MTVHLVSVNHNAAAAVGAYTLPLESNVVEKEVSCPCLKETLPTLPREDKISLLGGLSTRPTPVVTTHTRPERPQVNA